MVFIVCSKLECLHFGTWDSNKEWIVEMPEDENIEVTSVKCFVSCDEALYCCYLLIIKNLLCLNCIKTITLYIFWFSD